MDFRVVEVQVGDNESDDGWFMTLDTWWLAFPSMEDGGSSWVPLRGDAELFVEFGSAEGFLPLLSSDGSRLVFEEGDYTVSLGGVPVFLALEGDDTGGWDWLSGATPEEKGNLRMLSFEDEVTPEQFALLEELSLHNSSIEVATENPNLFRRLLGIFDPTFLPPFDDAFLAEILPLLAQEPELRTVLVESHSVDGLGFLKEVPRLETLLLSDWDPEEGGPLPDSIPGLRSILLLESDVTDLRALGTQPGLEELTIGGCPDNDRLLLDGLTEYPHLSFLAFRYCIVGVLDPLAGMEKLRWLGLPAEMTQAELEQVVLALPNLEVLELLESEEVTDLSPLMDLKQLKGLMVGSTAPPDPLFEMDHLEYLAVTLDSDEESPYGEHIIPRLQAALPETIVGRVDPFCLGSGYLLLLFPMVALAWFIQARRRKEKDPVPDHA